ncbi:hypothetical protein [Nitrospirillum viridazoti]|uniref:hypothetical protein n=1 Tax=Nitrospirillum viridazoti TaxID=3144925 RepID=UPI001642F391|nr:hypothetical protein [Nitrospirillum amazonense]
MPISMVVTKAYFLIPMMWFPLLRFIFLSSADVFDFDPIRIGITASVLTVTKVPQSPALVNFFLICFHNSPFALMMRQTGDGGSEEYQQDAGRPAHPVREAVTTPPRH